MNETAREIEIDAPVPAVWSTLVDVRRMPELSPSTESVDAPELLRAVGDRFEQTVRLGGRRFRSTWTVTRFEPGRLLAIEGKLLPGTHYEIEQELAPAGDRTRLRYTMRWRLPFGPLGRLAGRLGAERRALDEAQAVLDGIRRMAEASARVS
jgi:uncharacterized membrane protein